MSKKSNNEYLAKEIIIEGVLSIQAGDNPRIIREKIKALTEDEDDSESLINIGLEIPREH